MAEIPREILSEHFQERLGGRRVVSAVFTTYEFDPSFFEEHVLPVFLDAALSHVTMVRLAQLEEALRGINVAVYYDANGLQPGDGITAKLDVRRIPVRHSPRYVFHPKNVFVLVESSDPTEGGHSERALLVASMSANLTRAGWWENVEVCHVEEIAEGAKTRLRNDLIAHLDQLKRKSPSERDHAALRDVRDFLKGTEQRAQRSSNGRLHPHFYGGGQSLVDFLEEVAGDALRGANLEIISPFFDHAEESLPLRELIDRFSPAEVRVYLPRGAAGEGLVPKGLFESVRAMPRVKWGQLPRDAVKYGASADAGARHVHAKVYRFFTRKPERREVLFIGSANLTTAAHGARGNVETGFLVESDPPRPEFWLMPEEAPPSEFKAQPREDAEPSGGTRLALRYRWDLEKAEVFWDGKSPSPSLQVEAQGLVLFALSALPSHTWQALPVEDGHRVADALTRTSMFHVYGEGPEPGSLLVQEDGMWNKPSLLRELSAADILRYWSLLSPEQRAEFIEQHAADLPTLGLGLDLVADARAAVVMDTMFDRFAGFFHAFGCLERSVRAALDKGNEGEAVYRLFGRKYDSLGSLLERVQRGPGLGDDVERYVLTLCARQLCNEIRRDFPAFWADHASDAERLDEALAESATLRDSLLADNAADMGAFLSWFEPWFLTRAQAQTEEQTA